MKKNNKTIIAISFLLIVGLVVSLRMIKNSQDLRRSANFASGNMYLLPSSEIQSKVGENFQVQLYLESPTGKVDAARTFICFDENLIGLGGNTANDYVASTLFDTKVGNLISYNNKKCLDLTLLSVSGSNDSAINTFSAATITFKSLKEGVGGLDLILEKVEVTGTNPNSSDKTIKIDKVTGTTYKIVTVNKFKQTGCTKTNGKFACTADSFGNYDTQEACETATVCNQVIDCPARCSKNYGCTSVAAYKAITDCDHPIEGSVVRTTSATCTKIDSLPVGGNNDACNNIVKFKKGDCTTATGKFSCTADPNGTFTDKATCEDSIGCEVATSNSSNTNNSTSTNTNTNTNTTNTNTNTDTTTNASFPYVNFKVTFDGVKTVNSACAVNWPVKVIAINNAGITKSYDGVVTSKDGTSKGDLAVFKGSLRLADFPYTQNVSLFIKGPKHLQEKFGKNNQDNFYDKYIGELTLTTDQNSAAVDFSGMPISPGDVARAGAEAGQDGKINGNDFAYMKRLAVPSLNVVEGQDVAGDLDGNCTVNGNDINLFKVSLSQRSDRLY